MKEVEFGAVDGAELRVKPNLPVLGPKLGTELRAPCARRSQAGEFEELAGGGFRVVATSSSRTRCWSSARHAKAGRSRRGRRHRRARHELDDELELEGRVLDLIHS